MAIYVITFAVSVTLTALGESLNRSVCISPYSVKKSAAGKYCALAAALLAVVLPAALRSGDIGTDTLGYYAIYNMTHLSDGMDDFHNYIRAFHSEPLFVLLIYLTGKFTPSFEWLKLSFAILTNMPILYGIVHLKSKDRIDYPAAAWLVWLGLFYNISLNEMRQFAAIAFVFLTFCYVREWKAWKVIGCLLIATGFHWSALWCIVLYIGYMCCTRSTAASGVSEAGRNIDKTESADAQDFKDNFEVNSIAGKVKGVSAFSNRGKRVKCTTEFSLRCSGIKFLKAVLLFTLLLVPRIALMLIGTLDELVKAGVVSASYSSFVRSSTGYYHSWKDIWFSIIALGFILIRAVLKRDYRLRQHKEIRFLVWMSLLHLSFSWRSNELMMRFDRYHMIFFVWIAGYEARMLRGNKWLQQICVLTWIAAAIVYWYYLIVYKGWHETVPYRFYWQA